MTYLQFHLAFTVPPVVALALLQKGTREPWWPLGLMVVAAFAYTTPWDNWLVANAIWTYPPGAVLFTIGYVPVEEYAFFVLQTAMTGLWVRILQARMPLPPPSGGRARAVGAAAFGVLALSGVAALVAGGHALYYGLIAAWAFPVLAGMWGLGGHLLWARRRLLALAIAPTTLYLWVADGTAIRLGIWDITDATRSGLELAGLPAEEALFFLVTNTLVAQGLVMLERARGDES